MDQETILIVDDEPRFLEIYSEKLRAEGFNVAIAQGAEEGIKRAVELKPALILMDVKMPGMDGVGASLKLKEDASLKDTKIVFLTNLGDRFDTEMDTKFSKDIGLQGYIKKTDDLDAIIVKIKGFLGKEFK